MRRLGFSIFSGDEIGRGTFSPASGGQPVSGEPSLAELSDPDMAEPTIIYPGFLADPKSYNRLACEIAKLGYAAIVPDDGLPAITNIGESSRFRRYMVEMMAAFTLWICEQEGVSGYSTLGHSAGGKLQVEVALQPGLAKHPPSQITCVGPAGMNPLSGVYGAVAGLGREFISNELGGSLRDWRNLPDLARMLGGMASLGASNPLAALSQGYGAATGHTVGELRELADRGVVLVGIDGAGDHVFPPDDVGRFRGLLLPWHKFVVVDGGTHNLPRMMPELVACVHCGALENGGGAVSTSIVLPQ